MGGRGSRSGGRGGAGGAGGGLGIGGGVPVGAVQVPPITPGQPVPAVTVAELQAMNDQQFATYLTGLRDTPIDPRTYYNNDWDTQRLIANMPELNMAPDVVDQATFDSLPGDVIYRTVNAGGGQSAIDICGRTMASDVTTIGEGRMGDGFYFHASLSTSQRVYGNTSNNIQRSATMSAKLNSNARVVTESQLDSMLRRESPTVRNAVARMKSGGSWGPDSGLMAYALHKGYNCVTDGRITNVIDRRAATWSSNVIPVS